MAATQTQDYVSLKLLIDEKRNKVIFAEAGKDFVDVLFSFLTFPLGTIARLVEKKSNMEPVTVGCLNKLYQSVRDLDNDCLKTERNKEMLLKPTNSSQNYCSSLKLNIDDTEPAKYFFSLLQKLGVNGETSVKELIVTVTKDTVLDMLKCSMLSNNTLTHLFLRNRPSLKCNKFVPCDLENNCNIEIKVKLVMRKSDGKVLYAQGEQDFADLLLSFLSFPLGAVVRVLGGISSIENIDFVYKSIVELVDAKYFDSEEAKNRLVDPNLASLFKYRQLILPVNNVCYYCFYQGQSYEHSVSYDKVFFITDEYRSEFGGKYEILEFESPREIYEGYVKGPRAYMATDDLVLTPWSPISALHLINNLKIPFHDIKEKLVIIGYKECLNILKASLISASALTNGLSHLLTEVKEEIV